jgi:2-polyprenyl-6-methoxyphenol hydroxylase-like FAD-dependent oxidoreductase
VTGFAQSDTGVDIDFANERSLRAQYLVGYDGGRSLIRRSAGRRGGLDIAPWADRVRSIDAEYASAWELPVLGAVPAPMAVLIRPGGHVAWVGEGTRMGLREALTAWFGPPTA